MTELIKQTLLKKRDYEAEYRFLQQYLSDNRHKNVDRQKERLSFLEQLSKNRRDLIVCLTSMREIDLAANAFEGDYKCERNFANDSDNYFGCIDAGCRGLGPGQQISDCCKF